ncbi:CheR family methyltransferase [Paenibacillus endoradicis]|uniref:CheR family methyltransferase n=1 Tax=Paenibacillus endoradicis TaxID=2972487 RepID=UPI00358F3800
MNTNYNDDHNKSNTGLNLEPNRSIELEHIEIRLLLEGIYQTYGFDFRNYLQSSLRRRIINRMQIEQLPNMITLLEKVLYEPEFIKTIVNDLSIRVTEMYRDPSFFLAFRQKIVPMIRDYSEIRIWHAGCSTGEEVYSMAILLEEEDLLHKTKLYATDMNEQVIEQAKLGKFSLKRMQTFTKNYMLAGGTKEFSTYYITDDEYAIFHPEIMNKVVFAQHNLATDSTFNEFHIILCRNVMIYFDTKLQHRVHNLFYESLTSDGFLVLGNMESIIAANKAQYEDIVPCERIFRKFSM